MGFSLHTSTEHASKSLTLNWFFLFQAHFPPGIFHCSASSARSSGGKDGKASAKTEEDKAAAKKLQKEEEERKKKEEEQRLAEEKQKQEEEEKRKEEEAKVLFEPLLSLLFELDLFRVGGWAVSFPRAPIRSFKVTNS